jgi:nucleotide-binding universal stress UspA family protein
VVVVHKWLDCWSLPEQAMPDVIALDAYARAEKQAYLDAVTARLRQTYPVEVVPILLEGFPANQIATYAAQERIGLIVMATHGRGGFSRYYFGSVADQLIRHCALPILLCRANAHQRPAPQPPFRRILVALDGSPRAEAALTAALDLIDGDGTELVLFRAVKPAPVVHAAIDVLEGTTGGIAYPERRQDAESYLASLAAGVAARGIAVRPVAVVHAEPVTAILEQAEREPVDLIALATRGRGGALRALLGSVADKVVRRAELPVLICRPQGLGDEAALR